MAKEQAINSLINPLLAQLRDLHAPDPISFWPIPLGWYLLIFGLILACLWGWRYYQRGRIKRVALALLADYEKSYQRGESAQVIAIKISDLLRRVALQYFPRAEIAGLHGKPWLAFLKFDDCSFQLLDLPYQKAPKSSDLQALFVAARAWIKQRGGHV